MPAACGLHHQRSPFQQLANRSVPPTTPLAGVLVRSTVQHLVQEIKVSPSMLQQQDFPVRFAHTLHFRQGESRSGDGSECAPCAGQCQQAHCTQMRARKTTRSVCTRERLRVVLESASRLGLDQRAPPPPTYFLSHPRMITKPIFRKTFFAALSCTRFQQCCIQYLRR